MRAEARETSPMFFCGVSFVLYATSILLSIQRMTSSLAPTYWSKMCEASASVALPILLDRATGSSAVAIFSFSVAALISVVALFRWSRLEADLKAKVWPFCGRFLGLMFCGSCMGVIAWAANLLFLVYDYRSTAEPTLTSAQRQVLVALEHLWQAVFLVFCASALNLCLCQQNEIQMQY